MLQMLVVVMEVRILDQAVVVQGKTNMLVIVIPYLLVEEVVQGLLFSDGHK
jgi:hypothetical protein